MIGGSLFYVLSFILASFSRHLWHYLLTQGVLMGISNGLLFYGANGAITGWFNKHLGLALGLAACRSSVGGICWPLLIDKLLYSVGLQWTHHIMGLISLPILTAACIFVKERKTPATKNNSQGFAQWMEKAKSTLFRTDFLFMGCSVFSSSLVS
jgi:MFS family permease